MNEKRIAVTSEVSRSIVETFKVQYTNRCFSMAEALINPCDMFVSDFFQFLRASLRLKCLSICVLNF
jgi:hypothetical protein